MEIVLWTLQVLLGLLFVLVGLMVMRAPRAAIVERAPWAASGPEWAPKALSAAQIAGGIGLVLPMATGVLPWLTPAAAIGLVVVMAGAVLIHLRRHERQQLAFAGVVLVLVVVVAVGRTVVAAPA
ncbi:MAG: DoxX family protein [Dermatophilaceae bacterium]